MLTSYIVVSIALSIVCLVLFLLALNDWAESRDSAYGRPYERKENAARALAFLAGIALAWAWPIIVPLLFAYLTYRLIQDANAPDNNN